MPQQAKQVHSQEQGQLKHSAKRKGEEGPWPHLQQRRSESLKSMQGERQGLLGPPPLGESLLPRDKKSLEGSRANAWPGLEELERQLLHLPLQSWRQQTKNCHLGEALLAKWLRTQIPTS